MCWRNSRYWLENLDMIPYSNIDYSIQRICLNCCDNQTNRRCWPESRITDQYRYGGVFTYGDNPKEWNRPLMAHMDYNQKQDRLESMTRKGVCTSNFIKFLMQSAHYDRKGREENVRYYFGDPFETHTRSTNPPLSENVDFEDYFGDYDFQQWLNLRRDNHKEKIFPQMTREWTKTWYEFYRDVVAPDSNGSWYDFNKLKKKGQRKKKFSRPSYRRRTNNGQQRTAINGNDKTDTNGTSQIHDGLKQNTGDEHFETMQNDYDQIRKNEEVETLIEDSFNPFTPEPRRSKYQPNWRAIQEVEDPYSEELSNLNTRQSLLQPFIFHEPFSKTRADTFKQKIYVNEEGEPKVEKVEKGEKVKGEGKGEKAKKDENYEQNGRDQEYIGHDMDEQEQALQGRHISRSKTKPSKPRLTKKHRRQTSNHYSTLYAKYKDALEKMRRHKLLRRSKNERSGPHSHIRHRA
ncbi:hypothetical protein GQX74_007269 [Glossina fuscipes]|nr:hypothetical protein GQX74_007269 [Glossina fuscipes]